MHEFLRMKILTIAPILWMLTWPATLYAQAKIDQVEKLMELAGSTHTIELLIEEMQLEQVKEKINLLDDGLTVLEERLYFKKLSLADIKDNISKILLESLSEDEVSALVTFYEQPLIKRMLGLRKKHETNDNTQSTKKFLKALIDNPPARQRIELIHQLVDASLFVEQQVYLSAVISYEKNKTPLAFYERYDEEQAQRLEYYIERYKENMVSAIKPEARVTFMKIFAPLNDDEINQLISLLRGKERLAYQAAFIDAAAEVLGNGVKTGIIEILSHRKKRSS